jgi:hypothetical protein
MIMNRNTGGTNSFWTGGTRKHCSGQYSWCFSEEVSVEDSPDLQLLASNNANGACVVGSQVLNANGQFETSFINQACTSTAQLACVIHAKNYGGRYEALMVKIVIQIIRYSREGLQKPRFN